MTARTASLWQFRQPSVIPGFGLALGVTLSWLTLIILIPLSGLVWRSSALGWATFWELATDQRTVNALRISFGTAFLAALINVVFGVILAWVLVRYRFPGKRVIDAMVDLPFALPTAVSRRFGACCCRGSLPRFSPVSRWPSPAASANMVVSSSLPATFLTCRKSRPF
jgi:sulfate transport system permease protein